METDRKVALENTCLAKRIAQSHIITRATTSKNYKIWDIVQLTLICNKNSKLRERSKSV